MAEDFFWVMVLFVFYLGAIIGSFLNVCIVRLPQEKSIVFPASHCVHCHNSLAWYDNIPLVSCWVLMGRCRFCKEKISTRYFIVEFLTASLFTAFFVYFGAKPIFAAYAVMLCGLIVATFVDFEHRIIPDEISVGGIFGGLFFSFLIPQLHEHFFLDLVFGRLLMKIIIGLCALGLAADFIFKRAKLEKEDVIYLAILGFLVGSELLVEWIVVQGWFPQAWVRNLLSFDASLVGLLVGGGSIYAMGMLGDFLFKKESMGGGDVKLLAMIGAFLGWQLTLLSFFVAPFFGAVYGIIEKIRTKDSAIAYGPFLAIAALICIFWGERMIQWILGSYTLNF